MTTHVILGATLMFLGVVLLIRAAVVIAGKTPGAFRFDGLTGLFAAIALIAIGRFLIGSS